MKRKTGTSMIQLGCGLMLFGLIGVPVIAVVLIVLVAMVGG